MILLADTSDIFGFLFLLGASAIIPGIGVILSLATMRRHGLNPWCGISTLVFFATLLMEAVTWTLGINGGIEALTALHITLGGIALHIFGALLALVGLAQVRRRRKWAHGRRRAYWMFGMNLLLILLIGIWCYVHVNETLYDRLMH
jgi:hypothetical protein